jgi:hypothetical protein
MVEASTELAPGGYFGFFETFSLGAAASSRVAFE